MPQEDFEEEDLFEDAFGTDEEKVAAKKRLEEKKRNSRVSENKEVVENSSESIKKNNNEGKELGNDDDLEDEDEELEEEDEDKVTEPQLFVDSSGVEFESKDEAFEAMDAGGKKKTNTKNNFESIVDDGLNKSIQNVSSKKNNLKNEGKGYGGKLDLKVSIEDEEEDVEVNSKAHPIERNIIKSVIKNKAVMAAKQEVKLNKVKLSEDKPRKEQHDELADALLREEGIKEEVNEIKEKPKSEDDAKPKLPKASILLDEEDEDDSDNKIKPSLDFLFADNGHAYIGRKKSVLAQYGETGGLFVGRVNEKDRQGTDIYLDGLNPHVVFVCGARGSGKSYVLGVVAEELAIKNKNVGIVVVDPIGVFWSMKHPNKEARELEMLAKWDLLPRGLDNVKVFIPVGMKESVPKSTFDAVFSIQPSLLTAEDWCLTFGIDRFSPTGLLMEKGISKVKSGYLKIDGKEVRGKQNTFSLEDLVKCFEDDAELNDRDKGYKADSIRALVSRFDAAKHWGIFDDKGTSLGLLSRAGQMTILDTSFLDDSVSALVVGIFARRILAARKLGTRREAAGKFEEEADITELVELNIPPTWLFIDEAHTLIPGGNQKTPASSALVEYVKQGRRPGCSLVFATQQPSAIDSRVLSQLDVIMAHKLVFDDDIKAIHKRTPTIVPGAYKKSNFIKTLPIGTALTGDRTETTSRAFVMNIRPRMSQHEGRDAETIQTNQELDTDKVEMLAVNIVKRQLEKDPSIRLESVQETIDTLNNTYKKSITLEEILRMLNDNGVIEKEGKLFNKEVLKEIEEEENLVKEQEENEEESESNSTVGEGKGKTKLQRKLSKDVLEFEEELNDIEERIELTALRLSVEEQRARKILAGFAEKKFLFIENEILDRLTLKHAQIYKVRYKYFSHKDAFHEGEAFINSLTGEFIHDDRGNLRESKGLPILLDLNEAETNILKLIAEKKRTAKETAELMRMEEGNAKRVLDTLVKKKLLIKLIDEKKNELYTHGKIEMELPPTPLHEILPSIGKRQITEVDSAIIIQPILSEKEIPELLKKLWGSVIVKEITHLFLPIWEGVLKKRTGEEKIILIDGINGGRINPLQAQ
jgi:uncharacterized protein